MSQDTSGNPSAGPIGAIDGAAFNRMVEEGVPMLRGLLRRMVGHPDDVEDLIQSTLLKAWEARETFRGDGKVSTWLCSIGSRLAVDLLRGRKRWRERAQVIYAAACLDAESEGAAVGAALHDPGFSFDVREHIGYCFTCIGRTLAPEAQAALVLRDLLELDNGEAANCQGVSVSVFRHRLAAARRQMQTTYEGLCALTSKQGICWQCAGLRAAAPPDRCGPPPPATLDWGERLQAVRETLLAEPRSQVLQALFFRRTEAQEQSGRGDPDAVTQCGLPAGAAEDPA